MKYHSNDQRLELEEVKVAPFCRRWFTIRAWVLGICLLVANPLCLSLVEIASLESTPFNSESPAPVEADGESSPLLPAGELSSGHQRVELSRAGRRRLSHCRTSQAIILRQSIPGRDVVLLFQRFLC